jgi:Protein of unknown function (DUF3606)
MKDLKNNDHLAGQIVRLDDTKQIEYWCEVFQCDKQDLLFTVHKVGTSARMVDDFLILNRRKKTVDGK